MDTPIHPPREWFTPPSEGLDPTRRITITASGQVYGYIALWDSCHTGMSGCVKPPKGSPTNYEFAHQGMTVLDDGSELPTAVIAGGTLHAGDMPATGVPEYYENTGRQFMRVRYGEDKNGLWFAGALWPDVDELTRARINASPISGDWRMNGLWRKGSHGYDFAGACFVNIPGFGVSEDTTSYKQTGRPLSLVASIDTSGDITVTDNVKPCEGVSQDCGCTPETCTKDKMGQSDELAGDVITAAISDMRNKILESLDVIAAGYGMDKKKDDDEMDGAASPDPDESHMEEMMSKLADMDNRLLALEDYTYGMQASAIVAELI